MPYFSEELNVSLSCLLTPLILTILFCCGVCNVSQAMLLGLWGKDALDHIVALMGALASAPLALVSTISTPYLYSIACVPT